MIPIYEIRELLEDLEYYKRLSKKTEDRLQHYMSINGGLWLAMSQLPGGTEKARHLQEWGAAHEDEVIYFDTSTP